jgi:hypothetical protein
MCLRVCVCERESVCVCVCVMWLSETQHHPATYIEDPRGAQLRHALVNVYADDAEALRVRALAPKAKHGVLDTLQRVLGTLLREEPLVEALRVVCWLTLSESVRTLPKHSHALTHKHTYTISLSVKQRRAYHAIAGSEDDCFRAWSQLLGLKGAEIHHLAGEAVSLSFAGKLLRKSLRYRGKERKEREREYVFGFVCVCVCVYVCTCE